jgi:hypothetical protein
VILYAIFTRWGSRVGALIGGLLVVAVGVYFLLRNAFGYVIPDINWDLVWPVVVIVSGVAILSRAIGQSGSPSSVPERHAINVSLASDQPDETD